MINVVIIGIANNVKYAKCSANGWVTAVKGLKITSNFQNINAICPLPHHYIDWFDYEKYYVNITFLRYWAIHILFIIG